MGDNTRVARRRKSRHQERVRMRREDALYAEAKRADPETCAGQAYVRVVTQTRGWMRWILFDWR